MLNTFPTTLMMVTLRCMPKSKLNMKMDMRLFGDPLYMVEDGDLGDTVFWPGIITFVKCIQEFTTTPLVVRMLVYGGQEYMKWCFERFGMFQIVTLEEIQKLTTMYQESLQTDSLFHITPTLISPSNFSLSKVSSLTITDKTRWNGKVVNLEKLEQLEFVGEDKLSFSLIHPDTRNSLKSIRFVSCADCDEVVNLKSVETLEFVNCGEKLVSKIFNTTRTLKFLHVTKHVNWIHLYHDGLLSLQVVNVPHEVLYRHFIQFQNSRLEVLIIEWPLQYSRVKHQLHLNQFEYLKELVLKNVPPQAISTRNQKRLDRVVLFTDRSSCVQGIYQKYDGSNIQEIKF